MCSSGGGRGVVVNFLREQSDPPLHLELKEEDTTHHNTRHTIHRSHTQHNIHNQ